MYKEAFQADLYALNFDVFNLKILNLDVLNLYALNFNFLYIFICEDDMLAFYTLYSDGLWSISQLNIIFLETQTYTLKFTLTYFLLKFFNL